MLAVAEAARNVSCAGAKPLAITNCLNFGSPERPAVMSQFSLSIEGMAEACRSLGLPVVSGNVSFYNETNREDIYPTPIVGMVGLLDDVRKRAGCGFLREGDAIALLHPAGDPPLPKARAHEYVWVETGREGGAAPEISLDAEKAVQEACRRGIESGLLRSAHDLSEGGLGVALAESALASPESRLGAEVRLPEQEGRLDGLLFGEAASRILVSLSPEKADALREAIQELGAGFSLIGRVQEVAFAVKTPDNASVVDLTTPEIEAAWSGALSEVL